MYAVTQVCIIKVTEIVNKFFMFSTTYMWWTEYEFRFSTLPVNIGHSSVKKGYSYSKITHPIKTTSK